MSPLAIAAVVAVAAAFSRLRSDRAIGLVFLSAVATGMAVSVSPVSMAGLASACGAIIAGTFAAAAVRSQGIVVLALAVVVGCSAGIAATPDETLSPDMAVGAGLTVLALGSHAYFLLSWLSLRDPVIPRIAGAWCAAIGLMMGLLALAH